MNSPHFRKQKCGPPRLARAWSAQPCSRGAPVTIEIEDTSSTVTHKQKPQTIDKLRRLAAAKDTAGFIRTLIPLLKQNSDDWLATLKTQKLLSGFRSSPHLMDLAPKLIADVMDELPAGDVKKLEHHVAVCEFMQRVFDHIDRETDNLACCAATPDTIARQICEALEVANFAYQTNTARFVASQTSISMLQLAHINRRFRDVLDYGNIILTSLTSKRGSDPTLRISTSEMNELLRLASVYDEMRQLFDLYTYRDAEARIKRNSLVVTTTHAETDVAAAVGAERSGDHDSVRKAPLAQAEVEVGDLCAPIEVGPATTFGEYLRTAHRSEVAISARSFGRMTATDLEIEIAEYFALDTEVTTANGTFSVRELCRAWSLLVTLAMLGQRWNERRVVFGAQRPPTGDTFDDPGNSPGPVVLRVPVPELSLRHLQALIKSELDISANRARGLAKQFSSTLNRRIDLFYKPVILLPAGRVLLPTPYVRGSRFERNVFHLIASESDLDQKRKGYLPISELVNLFKEAGFACLSNFKVKINHREFTDIDLVAFKDGVLFLGQCKIVIDPDSLYDSWNCEQKMRVAASQLDVCLEHLERVQLELFSRLGVGTQTDVRIFPFVLTNSRQFTERTFSGYPVADVPYLRFLLSGARGGVILTHERTLSVLPDRAYIEGNYPGGTELAALLEDTIHRVKGRRISYRHQLRRFGNLKVHLPMAKVETAGESRYIIAKDEA